MVNQNAKEEAKAIARAHSQPLQQNNVFQLGHHPLTIVCGGIFAGFLTLNAAVLVSLPPVLRQRGAPYLPTFQKNLDAMFSQLRSEVKILKNKEQKLRFVDLGSGDGRVVFRAARERLFDESVGYEINLCKSSFLR
jgi:hypothetical protein